MLNQKSVALDSPAIKTTMNRLGLNIAALDMFKVQREDRTVARYLRNGCMIATINPHEHIIEINHFKSVNLAKKYSRVHCPGNLTEGSFKVPAGVTIYQH